MSRYKVSRYIGLTPQVYDVTGPDNQVIARMWSSNEEEVAHLARFIEAHDEIIDILSDAAYDYGDQAVNLIEMRALLQRLDLLARVGMVESGDLTEMRALLQRLGVYSAKLDEYDEKAKAAGRGGTITPEGEAI